MNTWHSRGSYLCRRLVGCEEIIPAHPGVFVSCVVCGARMWYTWHSRSSYLRCRLVGFGVLLLNVHGDFDEESFVQRELCAAHATQDWQIHVRSREFGEDL